MIRSKTKPDKTHEEAASLSELQALITTKGNQYKWGTEFTVYEDSTPANNGIYRMVYGQSDTIKTNINNLLKSGSNDSIFSAGSWIASLTTEDTTDIQNTVSSDISGQTGVKTFSGIEWNLTETGRTSSGTAFFLNCLKNGTNVFSVNKDGYVSANRFRSVSSELHYIEFGAFEVGFYLSNYLRFKANFNFLLCGNTTYSPNIRFAPSAGNPQYTFLNNLTSGIYSDATDVVSIVTGGIKAIEANALQNVTIPNGRLITTATPTKSPFQLGSHTADPSDGAIGYFTYNTTENIPKYHNGTTWKSLEPTIRLNTPGGTTKFDLLAVDDVDSKTKIIEAVAYNDTFDLISQNYQLFAAADIPNSTTILFEAEAVFIEGVSGNTGYGIKTTATFVKTAAGVLAMVGSATISHSAEDITGTPTLTFSVSSGILSVVANSGGSVGGPSVVKLKATAITNNTF